jgi:hypothetical protein
MVNAVSISNPTRSWNYFPVIRAVELTSWTWGLLEKPPVVQLLKNFSAFYGTRMFITVFIRALRWSLSWVRTIQSIPSHPISLKMSRSVKCMKKRSRWIRTVARYGHMLTAVRLVCPHSSTAYTQTGSNSVHSSEPFCLTQIKQLAGNQAFTSRKYVRALTSRLASRSIMAVAMCSAQGHTWQVVGTNRQRALLQGPEFEIFHTRYPFYSLIF